MCWRRRLTVDVWKSKGRGRDVTGLTREGRWRRDRGERGIRYSRREAQKYKENG